MYGQGQSKGKNLFPHGIPNGRLGMENLLSDDSVLAQLFRGGGINMQPSVHMRKWCPTAE